MRFENAGRGVLEGDIEIGRDQPFGHQRDDRVDVRIGIDVVQPDPGRCAFGGAQPAEFARKVGHVRADTVAMPLAILVADIDAISRRILRDDEQFPGSRRDELFSLAQDRVDAAADELSAQVGNDAEAARVVTALGDLEVAVVARG